LGRDEYLTLTVDFSVAIITVTLNAVLCKFQILNVNTYIVNPWGRAYFCLYGDVAAEQKLESGILIELLMV